MKDNLDLSLILACYNEIKRGTIQEGVKEIKEVLDSSKYSYEIIFIDDASSDGTKEYIEKLCSKNKNMKFIIHETNQGRGKSVTDGIKMAKGRITGYIDIDLETPAIYILQLAKEIEKGTDVATAHRIYNIDSKALHRWIAHKAYKRLSRYMLNTNFKDTEAGCKFFNKEKILPILNEVEDKHWFWDTEIMVRSYFKGLKIKEIPALFLRRPEKGSTLNFLKDSKDYFRNLIKFKPKVDMMKKNQK